MSADTIDSLPPNQEKRGGPRKGAGRKPLTPGEPRGKKSVSLTERTVRMLLVLGNGNLSTGVEKAAEVAYERYQRS